MLNSKENEYRGKIAVCKFLARYYFIILFLLRHHAVKSIWKRCGCQILSKRLALFCDPTLNFNHKILWILLHFWERGDPNYYYHLNSNMLFWVANYSYHVMGYGFVRCWWNIVALILHFWSLFYFSLVCSPRILVQFGS